MRPNKGIAIETENEVVTLPILQEKGISLAIKREDKIHPLVSGNKYRKLKFNLVEARAKGFATLLTFGGAFSNHILATAAAGKEQGFKTIGVIRGNELRHRWQENPTLTKAHDLGMEFVFVAREEYRRKEEKGFMRALRAKLGPFYLIPEGGTNALAVQGCEEILTTADAHFNVIAVSVGTGGTMAGLINASHSGQTVLGFPALKGDFLADAVGNRVTGKNWELVNDYHFGGYAKVDQELVTFINRFKRETGIPLDPIYTGKMCYGLLQMVKNDNFARGTRILAIHTGGLQGITGMNALLKKKNLSLLEI